MFECSQCHTTGQELARTGTTVWLGCAACHRVWRTEGQPVPPSASVPAARRAFDVRGRASAVLIAVLTVGAAAAARAALAPLIGDAGAFLLFAPAISVSAIARGPFAGAVATVLSAWAGVYAFLRPPGETGIEAWDHVALFVLVGVLITAISTVSLNARRRLSDALWDAMVARARAEAADREKEEFVALISHELRAPATVILGWASVLRQQGLSADARDRALQAVERNARVQSRLVSDMLDRSRAVAGTLRLDRARLRLGPILESAVEHVRSDAGERTPSIELRIPETEPAVDGDEVRLHQVFVNLLSNAVKFTPPDGHVTVQMNAQAGEVEVRVSDTGAGIAPEFLPHVFDLFRQSADTLGQSRRGLGLGLSVVRELVERHGGRVRAESAGPGRGATFVVTLPVAGEQQASPSPAEHAAASA